MYIYIYSRTQRSPFVSQVATPEPASDARIVAATNAEERFCRNLVGRVPH